MIEFSLCQDQHLPVVQNWHQSHSLTAAKVMNMPMRLLLGCAGDQLLLLSVSLSLWLLLLFALPMLLLLSLLLLLPLSLLLLLSLLFVKDYPYYFFAVGLGTAWIMASQSSTQTRIQNLTKSYLYLWICQALSCFQRYGPIAYRAVVAVAGCAPDPDLKAQVSSFLCA